MERTSPQEGGERNEFATVKKNMQNWKIFILSLRRVGERRLQALKQIVPLGLPFELVDAFDAKQVRPEFLVMAEKPVHDLSKGEIAAYHSLYGMMERIVDYGLDYGLILEDDFVFGDAVRLDLKNVWDHIPEDADHIQLHNMKGRFSPEYEVEETVGQFNKLSCTNAFTVGFIASRRLASYIVKHHPLPRKPFDLLIIEISRMRIFDFYDTSESVIDCDWGIPSDIVRPNNP